MDWLKVAPLYPDGSFSCFFNGENRLIGYTTDMIPQMMDRFFKADYAIIYINQWQRNFQKTVLDYVSDLDPEYPIWINGSEYARNYELPDTGCEKIKAEQ